MPSDRGERKGQEKESVARSDSISAKVSIPNEDYPYFPRHLRESNVDRNILPPWTAAELLARSVSEVVREGQGEYLVTAIVLVARVRCALLTSGFFLARLRAGLPRALTAMPLRLSVAIALLFVAPGMAQAGTYSIYTNPVFLYNDANIPTPLETTLSAAWADVQAHYEPQGETPINLTPVATGSSAITINGIWYQQAYGMQVCQGNNCTTYPTWGRIQTTYPCPQGLTGGYYSSQGSNPTVDIYECQHTVYSFLPPPKGCQSCLGNPIYAGGGQKIQAESDYAGAPGLRFERTYHSDSGSFASVTGAGFLNYSATMGTPLGTCYPGRWSVGNASGAGCYPYISPAQNLYQLVTEDGRYINFSGPNNAITQKADIDERVTQINSGGAVEWQVTREDNSIDLYNAAGQLIQKTLLGGRVITYAYSTSSTPSNIAPGPGFLIGESDPFGHTLSWTYNANGQMAQMTDPAGGTYQYAYDGSGNQTSVTYPDNTSKSYVYNESSNTGGANLPNAMTGIVDENNVRYATFQYAKASSSSYPPFAVSTQHAGGVDSYTFSYDSAAYYGNPITSSVVTDPLGTSRTYNFSQVLSYNQDSSISQPPASGSGTVTESWSRDANGNISQQTDFNGNITTYAYDLTRNLETSRTEAKGTSPVRTITTSWNANFRLPALITVYTGGSASGTPIRSTAFTYDSNGNRLTKTLTDMTVTPNVSRIWTYTYDSYGRMLTAKGPRTDVNSTTTYAYYTCTTGYQCGMLQTVTDPVGNVTTYNTYNAHGQPLTITDPNGVVTTLAYDARTRLTSRQVGTETTTFTYYPTGLLKQVTLPDSSYVLYSYDNAHRLTEVSDGAGNSMQYTLDNAGNRTAEKTYDPSSTLHRTHTRVFNSLNQLYQDINAANTSAVTTTYTYDNDANQTAIAAPLSRNTANVFDQLNRIIQVTDPNSGNTYFGYDAENDLTSVKDPRSLTTTYSYNGFGDVTQVASPDTGTTTSTYDSGGNLSTATDARGAISTYTYDAANRVTSIAYKLGSTTDQTLAFGYDSGTNGKGRLTSASDANHSLAWTYDGLGRVVGKGLTVGTVNLSVGYAYTNADLTALVTPSGQSVAYGFNSNHQITSITVNGTTVLSGVTYEPFGGANGWTWGDNSTAGRTFNGDGLISQIVTAGVTLGYTFDNANRITGISDSSNSALTWTYGYDSLDRLTSATTTAITDGWTYDADGNQLTQTGTTPVTFSVSSASNQLNATTGSLVRSYTYDAAGHVTGYGSNGFTYNNRGRIAATVANSTDYLYNALGQMIEKSGTLGTTILMQDESGHLIGEYNGSGALIEETIWLMRPSPLNVRPAVLLSPHVQPFAPPNGS